jgi:type I restriction enzyme S subunit
VLFPAEFEETELGYAPKGWVTNRLENILELAYEST